MDSRRADCLTACGSPKAGGTFPPADMFSLGFAHKLFSAQ
jgi:hypothetical protein